jgi:hypothetical protein
MLMRVLGTTRVTRVLAVTAGACVLALPASAGAATTTAPAAVAHPHRVVKGAGVGLGPAVKFVRLPDGTVRRVR